MLFLLFSLLERIKSPIGEANNLPRLTGINLTRFIAKNTRCIIIYSDPLTQFDFINFAVSKYRTQIYFAVASKNETIAPKCDSKFCIVPYINGNKCIMMNQAPKDSAIEFTNWCDKLLRPSTIAINHIDQLRRVFLEPGVSLLGVDMISKPNYISEKDDSSYPFYLVDHTLFQWLNISVSTGLYVYRSVDRQLIRAGENYKKFIKSPLVDLSKNNIYSKPYLAGFFVNKEDIALSNKEASMLTKLANKESFKNINFALIEGAVADEISLFSQLQYIKRPFFAIFNSSCSQTLNQRLVIKSDNINEVEQLINNVLNNNSLLLEKISSDNKNDEFISYNDFEKKLESTHGDKLVLFIHDKRNYFSRKFFFLIEKALSLIDSTNIHFYRYDLSENDIPKSLQIEQDLPILVIYPETSKGAIDSGLYYQSDASIEDLFDFIHFGSTNKFTIPEYNSTELMKSIEEKLNPLLGKEKIEINPKNHEL